MPKALHIHPKDNIAVCTSEVNTGDEVILIESDGTRSSILAKGAIPFCNKIALCDISKGETIVKYGEIIGEASAPIQRGTLVNHLNLASRPRAYAEEYLLKETEK